MQLEIDVEKRFADFHCRMQCVISHQRCGVFGPSGSGKSTLMHILSGLLQPDRGVIRLDGHTLCDTGQGIALPPEKRRVGVVFQHAHLFPHMNVRDNLLFGVKRRPKSERPIDMEQLLGVLQLQQLLSRRVAALSGGERQRVALARTILACPRLILLDEPLTGLDGGLKFQIIEHLRRVFAQFSIPMLFISHSLREMRLMTRHVMVMRNGAVERMATSEELARDEAVSSGDGYTNLLDLHAPEDLGDLLRYQWGKVPLMLVKTRRVEPGRFELRARDILLFKKHPEAASARNMLSCVVRGTYQTDWLVGVELECNGNKMIAEIVPQSVQEIDIRPGRQVIAIIKASAFQRLC